MLLKLRQSITIERVFATIAIVIAVFIATLGFTSVTHADTGYTATTGRPFAAWSVWNSAIKTNPTIDVKSAGITSLLTSNTANPGLANLYEFGIPVYYADASTPLVSVTCTYSPDWGTCPFTQVRIPADAQPHTGSDGAMVVIDTTNNKSYEFWQIQKLSSTQWQTSWGGIADDVINGAGDRTSSGSSVAAGTPRLAGLVLEREIAAGVIPHALTFSSKFACQGPNFRYPASKTDGASADANCIPEGTRVQLDPSINVDTIPGITAGEKAVAKALQTYGAHCIDKGGANMAFGFELPKTATATNQISQTYLNAGFGWDYFGMNSIPWNKLKVLANWDGGAGTPPAGADVTAPTAPSGLRTTSLAPTSVSLQWIPSTDNVGVTKYNVWRGDKNWANWKRIAQVSGTTTTYTDKTVKANKAYTYAVRAQDAAGNISDSINSILVPANR